MNPGRDAVRGGDALPADAGAAEREERGRRVGIMGGTFDPIHIGHLILGECAWKDFGLDTVVFMPSGNPPHKQDRAGRASGADRLAMTALAVSDNPHFEVSDLEMRMDGLTYTYRTLETMKRERPADELFFIIGADSLIDFDTWRHPGRICELCTLLIAPRDHIPPSEMTERMNALRERYGARTGKLSMHDIDISSRNLREAVRDGRSVRYAVPDSVRRYIGEHHLYR